jgi:succinate-acetate transporter protein
MQASDARVASRRGLEGEQALAAIRIVLRPIASPLPLGLFAFAVGSVVLSALDMKLLPPTEAHHAALIMLGFVAPLELFASVFAFLARDGAGGSTLGLFGASWVTLALSLLASPPGALNPALGVFLFAVAGAMAILAITAAETQPFFAVLLTLALTRFVLTGLAEAGLGEALRLAAGIVGWLDAAIALYGALALLLEDGARHAVLPLFRRHAAQRAPEGGPSDRVRSIEHEAGVRDAF